MWRSRCSLLFSLVAVTLAVACGASSAGSEDLAAQVQALTKRIEALERELAAIKTAGAPAQPNAQAEQEATAALGVINQLVASGKYDEAKAKLGELQTKYGSTRAGRSAGRLMQELAVVGKDAPTDWGIERWFQGQDKVNLTSGATTLVVFWETWCPHCQREVPKLQAVYDTYSSKGLQVVGLTKVSKTATEQGVTDFIAQQKVSYPVAKENGSTSNYFGVSGIPAAAVVKGGRIVWRGHPAALTDEMLKGWL
jgi:thiol-disulfide isomerase/thioredoxin